MGISAPTADNLPFLKGTSDFLRENKCLHTYYLRTLQRRLDLDVPFEKRQVTSRVFGTSLSYLTVWIIYGQPWTTQPSQVCELSQLCMVLLMTSVGRRMPTLIARRLPPLHFYILTSWAQPMTSVYKKAGRKR